MQMNLSSNVREVISDMDLLFNDQVPFALAKAMTETARAVSDAMPGRMDQDFDRPTEFTKRGFYVQPARKDQLEATVGVKDRQAEYLGFQIEGGERKPKRVALRLPAKVQLDQYGNIPSGLIKQLIARAAKGKRATKAQARRFGVSQENELFYGEPGRGRPAGIYQRTQGKLLPLVLFPKMSAQYEARFDFVAEAVRVVEATFSDALDRAWSFAKATAR